VSGGKIIDLGGLPGFTLSDASSINDTGQIVGFSDRGGIGPFVHATEWSDGQVIDLGAQRFFTNSIALGINNAGQVVGQVTVDAPESSTWAMVLLGFGGLGYAAYRRRWAFIRA
jgi:probable HAF family extracellular repeat protein